ncbi:MAG: ABC transporter ATP-binding protein [Candidatus Hydrogenedentes bacterium]|jgi:oligopeptide/dipeptide ABC transporter ATP-binding protein|nr:ABC transporter ATP-binding protein [Candidatus Hydrogenedentota bacterium]
MTAALLEVKGLIKRFPVKAGVFSRTVGAVHAVEDISFSINRGKTLSLVGESGSGKTTAGRCLLRLIEPDAGSIRFDGVDVVAADKKQLRTLRRRMQMVFQDPFASLNPRMTVQSMLSEVLTFHRITTRRGTAARVMELLEQVGLPRAAADRYPHEFSGGQRQRIGIARALAVEPQFIVADEPVSALDVSIQAQILNLLQDLQEELGLTFLFIGHNLDVVRHISDTVAVMYLGHIVEMAPVHELFSAPLHPYTETLLAAVPRTDPEQGGSREIVAGDPPSPIHPPSGCPFHPRCPIAIPSCAQQRQQLVEVAPGHQVACSVRAPLPDNGLQSQ